MLKKERWIVYPLLMLSLFSSLIGVQVIRAQQQVLDMVVTKELRVVNDEGETVAMIRHEDGLETSLILRYGNHLAHLVTDEFGPAVNLYNDSLSSIHLSSNDKRGQLGIYYGQHEVQLQSDNDGGSLRFGTNQHEIHYLRLGGSTELGGFLTIENAKGDHRAALYESASGHGALWLFDKYGDKSREYTYYDLVN